MTYVRYHSDVEAIQPEEAETLAKLSRTFREVQERVLRKHGAARHARQGHWAPEGRACGLQ